MGNCALSCVAGLCDLSLRKPEVYKTRGKLLTDRLDRQALAI